VKFPVELDALDLATDELKGKMLPASRRLKEIEKERAERRKVRKRMKIAADAPAVAKTGPSEDVEMGDASAGASASAVPAPTPAPIADGDKGKEVAAGELEDESLCRAREIAELEKLVHPDLRDDVGCSVSGLYELVGEYLDSP
jgi:ubiquitin carboxyl-terminal hydrolase 14